MFGSAEKNSLRVEQQSNLTTLLPAAIIFGITNYNKIELAICIKNRILELGKKNIVGARVSAARKAFGTKQVVLLKKLRQTGIEISVRALSLLEGQKRPVTGIELNALADIWQVPVDWLLGRNSEETNAKYTYATRDSTGNTDWQARLP